MYRGKPAKRETGEFLDQRHTGGNDLDIGSVAASHGRPPSMDRDGPFGVEPSALMKDQEEEEELIAK